MTVHRSSCKTVLYHCNVYDQNFNITGTEVQKAYENVRTFDEMDDNFKDAWEQATDYLPAFWASGAVQFAEEGNQILVIATADDPSALILPL